MELGNYLVPKMTKDEFVSTYGHVFSKPITEFSSIHYYMKHLYKIKAEAVDEWDKLRLLATQETRGRE